MVRRRRSRPRPSALTVSAPLVRYGPNEYSVDDPSAARIIYGHGTHFTKSSWYAGWGVPGKPTLFTDRSAFIDQTIAKRKAEPAASTKDEQTALGQPGEAAVPQDFLSTWLAFHAEDPTRFTAYNVVVGMIANIIAGSDTTSTTLSAILYYLLKHPETLAKLRKEITLFQQAGELSDPIAFKQSQAMPYLQAVIKETQRLHPATGLPLAGVVPEGGATICRTFFPRGVSFVISPSTAHEGNSFFSG